jgi:hypothetical protein
MRFILLLAVPLLVQSSKLPESAPEVVAIEIIDGAAAVSINRSGEVRYIDADPTTAKGQKRLMIGPDGFARLQRRLQRYRLQAKPTKTGPKAWIANVDCGDWISNQDSMIIQWIGPRSSHLYFVDFGCDYKNQAARNGDLLSTVNSIPRP